MRHHELSDEEWEIIAPLLPTNSRGIERVDDRRVINGILWRFRTGSSWRDVPERYGPRTTLYNRFSRWRAAGVWDCLLDAVSKRYDGDIVMIDSSCVRVHQHGGNAKKGALPILAWDVLAAALRQRSMLLSMPMADRFDWNSPPAKWPMHRWPKSC